MTPQKANATKALTALLIISAVILRVISLPHSNRDMFVYNLRWYETLNQQGIANALGTNFSNYAPPYTYLLALATLTHNFIAPLTAIKLIPIFFDILGAIFVYKIVRLRYARAELPSLAAAIYFVAPTVILNSAYWGQADSIYTSALLICLYLLMTDRTFAAMLAFGAAFSVKAQAVFLLPVLGVMAMRKKIHWLYFGAIPLVYLIAIAPVVILGRPFMDALLVYAKQSDTFKALAMNAPNVYNLFQKEWYSAVLPFGLTLAAALTLLWMYAAWQSKAELDHKTVILFAFLSTALTPFVLPKMHDRYFYPADAISIVLAFYWPELWFVPILMQLGSGGAISVFLFHADPALTVYGFLFITIALAAALRTQRKLDAANKEAAEIWIKAKRLLTSLLAWMAAILLPVALMGIGLSLLLTPIFLRVEYALHLQETNGLSKSDRFQIAAQVFDYFKGDQKPQFLHRLNNPNGAPIFNEEEINGIDALKQTIQSAFSLWHLALAFLYLLLMLAWASGQLNAVQKKIKVSGWISIGAAILLAGLAFLPAPEIFSAVKVFPQGLWRDAILSLGVWSGAAGYLCRRAADFTL